MFRVLGEEWSSWVQSADSLNFFSTFSLDVFSNKASGLSSQRMADNMDQVHVEVQVDDLLTDYSSNLLGAHGTFMVLYVFSLFAPIHSDDVVVSFGKVSSGDLTIPWTFVAFQPTVNDELGWFGCVYHWGLLLPIPGDGSALVLSGVEVELYLVSGERFDWEVDFLG